jgi:hypothetical protein
MRRSACNRRSIIPRANSDRRPRIRRRPFGHRARIVLRLCRQFTQRHAARRRDAIPQNPTCGLRRCDPPRRASVCAGSARKLALWSRSLVGPSSKMTPCSIPKVIARMVSGAANFRKACINANVGAASTVQSLSESYWIARSTSGSSRGCSTLRISRLIVDA